jgi:predicted Fe-Mo cluster-binding NifX family protein
MKMSIEFNFKGKIAVATNDQRRVTGHIGKCKAFAVYEINDCKITGKEIRDNLFTNHGRMDQDQHHAIISGEHGHSHTRLIEGLKDCKYLISRGGGWRVVEDLKKHNIHTLFSDVDLIEDAVSMFTKGELMNDDELTCNHDE